MNLTGRPIIQKANHFRSKSVTALAHESPCHATFPHDCVEARGCDPAHGNWQAMGKGVHLKVSDWLVAFVCRNAHDILDGKVGQDTLPKHMREYYWIQAFISSWDWAWREKKIRLNG
jgi:hypothetical protein